MLNFSRKIKLFFTIFSLLLLIVSLSFLKNFFENFASFFYQKFIAFAQWNLQPSFSFALPRYPQRISYLVEEISLAIDDLVFLNETLKTQVEECDCKNTQSQCQFSFIPVENIPFSCASLLAPVIGDPCKNRIEINEIQEEIFEKSQELIFLQEVLQAELDTGLLQKEVETLDPEIRENLKSNLEKVLSKAQEAIEAANKSHSLPDQCSSKNCLPVCLPGTIKTLDVCLGLQKEQKPITLKFKLSVGLDDLDLGEVRVNNINLTLPEKIDITQLGYFSPFTIDGQEFVFSLDNLPKTLRFQVPQPPSIPQLPSITFGCPNFPKKTEIDSTSCDHCNGKVYVRGRYGGGGGYNCTADGTCDNCTGFQPATPCAAFCMHTKEYEWGSDQALIYKGDPAHITKEQIISGGYERIFTEIFGVPVPDEGCTCTRSMFEVYSGNFGGQYTSGKCRECTQIGRNGFSVCKKVDWCQENCQKPIEDTSLDWFLQTIETLSKLCQELPGMTDANKILTEDAEGCLDPERVIKTIKSACEKKELPTCENCSGVYVRGRYAWFYGKIDFSCGGDVCGVCTGVGTPSNPPTPCQAFCHNVKENDWPNPDKPTTFDKNFLMKYEKLFSHFGWSVPESCTCSREIIPPHSNYSNYCRNCVALPSPEGMSDYFSACTQADWCDQNCPQVDRCSQEEDLCSSIGIPPGEECIEKAAKKQCEKLFSGLGESIPNGCLSNPIDTIKNKCNQLKKEGRKEAPETCKILPLFTGNIEMPTTYSYQGGGTSIHAQKIFNYPPSILGCPSSLPNIPKLCLPYIKIPDLKLPEFKLSIRIFGKEITLFRLKLPSIIIEDVDFPCIELCNINECQNIFPYFNFQMPILSLPTIELPSVPLGEIDGFLLPDLELSPIILPSIPYPFLKIPSLGNVMLPELEIPRIDLPKPRITFGLSSIDLSPIFGYIVTLIKNALGISDSAGGCLHGEILSPPLEIIFPDYYFSWSRYIPLSKIPKIPYCADINQFCRNLKEDLNDVLAKVKKIEDFFNNLVYEKIQSKLDEAAIKIQQELTKLIEPKIQELRDEIRKQIEEQIKEGKREIVVRTGPIEIPKFYLDEIAKIDREIPINWPEELKKIRLNCDEGAYYNCYQKIMADCEQKCASKKTSRCNFAYLECHLACQVESFPKCKKESLHCLRFKLPIIPLSCLSYSKEFPIKGPGLSSTSVIVEANLTECKGAIPLGGSPCPKNEFENILDQIKKINVVVGRSSQEILEILK